MTDTLAIGVIDQNIVIDCGTHEEALRLVDRVTLDPRPDADALREAAQAVVDAWRRVDYVVYDNYEDDEDILIAAGLTLDAPMSALRAALAAADREEEL